MLAVQIWLVTSRCISSHVSSHFLSSFYYPCWKKVKKKKKQMPERKALHFVLICITFETVRWWRCFAVSFWVSFTHTHTHTHLWPLPHSLQQLLISVSLIPPPTSLQHICQLPVLLSFPDFARPPLHTPLHSPLYLPLSVSIYLTLRCNK